MISFQKGLVSISFRKLSPEEIIRALEPLPVDGIEWGGDIHVPHGNTGVAERIGQATRMAGLEPFCYGSYYNFKEVNPEGEGPSVEIEAVLDTANALGSERIRLWAGEMDFEDASQSYRQAVADRAREIGEMAERRGLAIDLEFHGKTLNNSPANSLKLLAEIDHANVHTLWQPALGISFAERLEGLQMLLPRVSNVHCFHWGPGGIHDRRPLAEGEDDWRAYLEVLAPSGNPRWVSLEYVKDDSLESLTRDSQSLAQLTGQMPIDES
jgi:sugar phosphate isomerase/epimerase